MLTQADLEIATLGPNNSRSPLELSNVEGDGMGKFVLSEVVVGHL